MTAQQQYPEGDPRNQSISDWPKEFTVPTKGDIDRKREENQGRIRSLATLEDVQIDMQQASVQIKAQVSAIVMCRLIAAQVGCTMEEAEWVLEMQYQEEMGRMLDQIQAELPSMKLLSTGGTIAHAHRAFSPKIHPAMPDDLHG